MSGWREKEERDYVLPSHPRFRATQQRPGSSSIVFNFAKYEGGFFSKKFYLQVVEDKPTGGLRGKHLCLTLPQLIDFLTQASQGQNEVRIEFKGASISPFLPFILEK